MLDVRVLAAASLIAGAAPDPSASPLGEWVQLINLPLSILILYGFARGWFITGKEHQRVVEERDKERQERIEAQQALTEKAMPTLQQNELTMGKMVDAMERMEGRRRSG